MQPTNCSYVAAKIQKLPGRDDSQFRQQTRQLQFRLGLSSALSTAQATTNIEHPSHF
jgi:hypothetical protein